MYRHVPNSLTILRLLLAGVFFVILNQYRYPVGPDWALPAAIAVFVLAALSDTLDGYLARRWKVETAFGRIMDPFCDKVLVIGSFVYLAGPRFVIPERVGEGDWLNMATGVYPWMVAVVLARELLVTSIRGVLEGAGLRAGALFLGKLKMILQSLVVPILLLIVWLDPRLPHDPTSHWLPIVRDALVYATVLITLLSGWPYVTGAAAALRQDRRHV